MSWTWRKKDAQVAFIKLTDDPEEGLLLVDENIPFILFRRFFRFIKKHGES